MGTSGSTPDAIQEGIWGVFSEVNEPHTPLTTAEIAERLECDDDTVQVNLETLAECGELNTREIADRNDIWWRSDGEDGLSRSDPGLQEFGAFVSAVKDYAIFMLEPDGTVASWNEGARRIKGYAEEEIVGEHFSTFYTDDDIDDGVPEANLETAVREGRVEDEGWRRREDGSRFWANVVITAIRDDDGELQGFTKVTRDMTEQREYEQQLRQERDLIEQIFETVPVSIYTIDADGEFVRANQIALDRIDSDRADLEGLNVDSWEIYDGEGDPIPRDDWPWTRVIETGEPVYDYQCQSDLPGLGRRWLSINTVPISADHQGEEQFVVSVDDITKQKEHERQLRRERDQTEQLLRTAPIAIAVSDAEGNTILANQRAQETLGLSEQELIEEPDDASEWNIYDADGNPLSPDETPSARVLRTGESVRDEEFVIEPPAGDRMRFRLNAAPLGDGDGTVDRVVTTGEDITELRKREQQLQQRKRELETELSEILERISDAFYAVDDDWQFTHVNDRAAEIFQRPRDALLGRDIWEIFPNRAESVYQEKLETAMESQEPISFDVYEEGIDSWLEFNAYPSETGLSVYFRDVTERIEHELELEQYKAIVEAVNDGVYVVNEDGSFSMVNQAYAELTGYDRDELVGEDVTKVVGEDVRQRAQELETAILNDQVDDPGFEASLETRSGEQLTVDATFAILPHTQEQRRVGVVRDITQRREAQRKLAESERRYRTLIENFPNGAVGLYNEDLEYIITGGQAFEDVDVSEQEVVGSTLEERYSDDLIAEIKPYFEAALQGESNTFEYRAHGRDVWAHTVPLRDEEEEIFGGMVMAQDISERREYERKLEESNERLEQFAYAASHDLQEPLRMITSYLQLIDRRYADELDEDGREFIEFAVDGADRMRNMIEGLLDYSRVDTRGNPFEPVDLNDVLANVRDDLQVRIGETDAEITAETLPTVSGDEDQLRQLFQNLLDNAIEYRGEERPQIQISAEQVDKEWQISVSDRGIGIDPEDSDRVFEVFQRLHAHDEHDGTGIGLALCERIVERHGGDIWVDSEPGEGTTFSFTFPVGDFQRD